MNAQFVCDVNEVARSWRCWRRLSTADRGEKNHKCREGSDATTILFIPNPAHNLVSLIRARTVLSTLKRKEKGRRQATAFPSSNKPSLQLELNFKLQLDSPWAEQIAPTSNRRVGAKVNQPKCRIEGEEVSRAVPDVPIKSVIEVRL